MLITQKKKKTVTATKSDKRSGCFPSHFRYQAAPLFVQIGLFLIAFLLTSPLYAEPVTLNFKGADIKAVITSVAEITNKNFIVDPRVKGKVTIISHRQMNRKEIYQVFLSVLEVHGYAAVPSGKTIKIIPDADAKHSGMPSADGEAPGEGDEAVTRVIEVQHVTAAQLVPILRPLVPPQGHLAAYPQSNVLIVSDRARNIERLMKIIERIDQPSSGEIEIVQLEYAAASDLVRVLTTLQQQDAAKGKAQGERPTLVADERTNSILIGGDRSQRLQLRAIISHLDTPSEVEGDTHVVYLRYAKAKDLVPVLTGVGDSNKNLVSAKGKGGAGGAKSRSKAVRSGGPGSNPILNIQADESTNALVITAPPALYRSLESVIRLLDVRRAQVMVEAVIAEVSSSRQAELGVNWLFDGSGSDNPVGAIDFSNFAGAAAAASAGGSAGAAGIANLIGKGATLAFGKFNSDTFNFASLIKALEGDGETNILSTPSIVTLDNEEAEIFIGQEISIPSGSFSSTGTGSNPTNPFTTFDRVPVGIKLKVKPQINEGDAIRLDIEQSVDSFQGDAGTGSVVTSERTFNTSVLVDDGTILVLGGLIKDDLVESQSKVPLLGDIPLLGAFFRSETVTKVKNNLMVFLRPVIMRDAKVGLTLTNSKYNYIRQLQMERSEDSVQLLSDERQPMLPEIETFLELPPPFEDKRQILMKNRLFKEENEEPKATEQPPELE